jgi:hypothetical protein
VARGQDSWEIRATDPRPLAGDDLHFFLAFVGASDIQLASSSKLLHMKNYLKGLALVAVSLALVPAYAQMGGRPGMAGPQGPQFTGALAKLFGDNSAFSAKVEIRAEIGGEPMTMPAKISFDKGMARMEMDLTEMKGGHMPPQALAHLKSMGMDNMVTITLPEKKVTDLLYPGLQAYCEVPMQNPEATKPESDFNIETTELGTETVDGHSCVKNKVVVTDKAGTKEEFTVWNATDLKKFPVQIEMTHHGVTSTIQFSDIKLSAPDASLFAPPADYKKYDSMQEMMQQEMMKKMGGGMGMPPHHQ